MPPTANRRIRPTNSNDDTRRSLLERRESKAGDDSDSLMSGAGSDDDDGEEDEDEGEGENGENGERNRSSHVFKGEFIMPPYEHAKRQLSQLFGMFHLGEIILDSMLRSDRTHEWSISRSCPPLPARRGMVA